MLTPTDTLSGVEQLKQFLIIAKKRHTPCRDLITSHYFPENTLILQKNWERTQEIADSQGYDVELVGKEVKFSFRGD